MEVSLRVTKGGTEVARESLGKGEARQCSEVKKATGSARRNIGTLRPSLAMSVS